MLRWLDFEAGLLGRRRGDMRELIVHDWRGSWNDWSISIIWGLRKSGLKLSGCDWETFYGADIPYRQSTSIPSSGFLKIFVSHISKVQRDHLGEQEINYLFTSKEMEKAKTKQVDKSPQIVNLLHIIGWSSDFGGTLWLGVQLISRGCGENGPSVKASLPRESHSIIAKREPWILQRKYPLVRECYPR